MDERIRGVWTGLLAAKAERQLSMSQTHASEVAGKAHWFNNREVTYEANQNLQYQPIRNLVAQLDQVMVATGSGLDELLASPSF